MQPIAGIPPLAHSLACFSLAVQLGGIAANQPWKQASVPVSYKNQMLILSNRQGAAAVVFGPQTKHGVHYRYRYLPKKGKEVRGKGKVFEKYRVVKQSGNTQELVDAGSQLTIQAGAIQVRWSRGGGDACHIYHDLKIIQVKMGKPSEFEELRLQHYWR
jgi:hypothetical protein